MSKFLLDANISPETCDYLARTFDFDVIDLTSEGKVTLQDEEVIQFEPVDNGDSFEFRLKRQVNSNQKRQ